ncbi:hypothetical protein OJAV_G00047390 [Oryzias javanicus]|uniref:Uncharacterized protein n=1 Tax=Oryzias javanicus TaxID=123683 RepID=A0A437DDW2_ORYJA|nr:hypothetical protein OJAV_G00047390 [Oryzias javanicus]
MKKKTIVMCCSLTELLSSRNPSLEFVAYKHLWSDIFFIFSLLLNSLICVKALQHSHYCDSLLIFIHFSACSTISVILVSKSSACSGLFTLLLVLLVFINVIIFEILRNCSILKNVLLFETCELLHPFS